MALNCGDHALYLWKNSVKTDVIEEARKLVGETGKVQLENVEQLGLSSHEPSSFDATFFGFVSEESQMLGEKLLSEVVRILKPSGTLYIKKSPKEDCRSQDLVSSLKFSGFVNVNESPDVVKACKPNYELGSSVKLNFKSSGPSESSMKMWEAAAEDHEKGAESELIDDSDLLDELDLKKPDPESLRVCGTTGKRKACANCSCGLAEELEKAEIETIRKNTQTAKSSCGSCYLGDAFRCASCPYLGMPAFKPGEKVVIDTSSDL